VHHSEPRGLTERLTVLQKLSWNLRRVLEWSSQLASHARGAKLGWLVKLAQAMSLIGSQPVKLGMKAR
jgi:hypothetical protein